MNTKYSKMRKATALVLLACIFLSSSLQTLKVTGLVAMTIEPTNGKVGTIVEIDATIDTENGFYTIRWNGTLNVTTGYAVGETVQTSFTVPQTAGAPGGRDILVEIIDNATRTVGQTTFKLYPEYHIKIVKPSPPNQLQEGATTNIWVNITGGKPNTIHSANITVKDPANITFASLITLNANTMGYVAKNVTYPTNFSAGAHTNYPGRYTVAFNETLTTEFSVGLTNATQYDIFQTVNILAANYANPAEHAWVNITYNGETRFSENVSATNGLIQANWTIPVNASIGTYTVTIVNSTTPGTVKPVNDTQQFVVKKPVFTVHIKTVDLGNEPVPHVSIFARNQTSRVGQEFTDESSVATFLLEMGNYTFEAFFELASVGALPPQYVMENKTLTLTCQLMKMKILIEDKAGTPLPFIRLTVDYNYTTRLNMSMQETQTSITNQNGISIFRHMYIGINYVIETERYGHIFNETYIENVVASPWFNITINLPTYTALVHVMDSKANAAEGVKVEAYEWNGGLAQYTTTDSNGDASFALTFGKYRIRAYKDDILLNETTIDLIQNQSSFIFHLATFNVDLNVLILDYFGQPFPNAMVNVVKVEQETTVESVNGTTGPDGHVTFSGILGGDSRMSIYLEGQLSGTKDLYLTDSKQVTFHLSRYVVIAGYVMETSQFVTAIALAIIIVAFIVALTYKRLFKIFLRSK